MSRSALPQYYRPTADVELENFSTGWARTGSANGTVADDTTIFLRGTKGQKMTTTTPNADLQMDKTVNITGLSENMVMNFYIYLHNDPADYTYVRFYISTVSNLSVNKLIAFTSYTGFSWQQGWNKLSIPFKSDYYSGSDTFSGNFVKMRFVLKSAVGVNCAITLGAIDLEQPINAKTILRFDDAWETVYTNAFPVMQARGIKGAVYAIGSYTGAANYCTLAQLQELYDAGWDVGNHSWTHSAVMNTLNYDQVMDEYGQNQQWLLDNGFTRSAKHIALTNGHDNATIRQVIADIGAEVVTTSVIDSASISPVDSDFNSYSILTRFNARSVLNTTTLAAFLDNVQRAGRFQHHVHMFHEIVTPATTTYKCTVENFTTMCDYLLECKMDIVTMSEFVKGLTNPRKLISRS